MDGKSISPFAYFLNGYNPDSDSLVRTALEDWTGNSGLLGETLEKYQVRLFSGNADALKERLGFASFDGQGILRTARLVEIPSFSPNGAIISWSYRLYPPLDGRRYLHPKGQPARPYILPEVWSVREKTNKPLWITEGAKKALKLVQHGRHAISLAGVWSFKEGKDGEETFIFDDLEQFVWKGRTVFMGFDADLWTNPGVRFALYELALKLMTKGALFHFPKWAGAKGIDDYLVMQQGAEKALSDLEGKALPFDRFVCPDHRDAVVRALRLAQGAFSDLDRESIVTTVAKKLNIRPKRLFVELQKDKEAAQPTYSDDEKAAALELLKKPDLVTRFLSVCHTRYLGRDETLILVKLACVTRHFNRGLSVILSATSSTGKSFLIEIVLLTCDPGTFENFTRTSAQYLLYRQEPLDHVIVTYFELQGTGQTAEIIRTALSEGTLRLGTVLKDSTGSMKAENIEKDTRGLVILSTHTGRSIDHELATRVLTQEITHDEALARDVYRQKANRQDRPNDNTAFRLWQVADSLIEPLDVQIPYLPQMAELFPTDQERYHRDFEKVIALVKASALLHQYQRERTGNGAVIADRRDYGLVYSLSNIFAESVLPVSEPVLKLLDMLQNNPDMTRAEAQDALLVSDKTLRRQIEQAARAGFLETEGRGTKQTFKVVEIPKPQTVLPSPEEIFSYLPHVQMSNTQKTNETQDKTPDNGDCPIMSNCPKGEEEAAGTMPELDNWTKLDKGACPMDSVDRQGETGNRTTGHEKGNESLSGTFTESCGDQPVPDGSCEKHKMKFHPATGGLRAFCPPRQTWCWTVQQQT